MHLEHCPKPYTKYVALIYKTAPFLPLMFSYLDSAFPVQLPRMGSQPSGPGGGQCGASVGGHQALWLGSRSVPGREVTPVWGLSGSVGLAFILVLKVVVKPIPPHVCR